MLVLDIAYLAVLKGEKYLVPFLVRKGMSLSRAKQLAHGGKVRMLRDDTVRELCEILECMPNALFNWTGASDHRLGQLKQAPAIRLQAVLVEKSEAEIAQLWKDVLEREPRKLVRGGVVWLNVRRMMELRSAEISYKTLQRYGFSEMVARTLTDVKRRDGRVYLKMQMLTRLCEKLGCEPNDLYDFAGPEGHVLDGLRKTHVAGLDALIKRMTPEEVRRLLG